MNRKIITYLLLFSFLNYLGCYSSEIVSRDNYYTLNDYDGEIKVTMKYESSYNYSKYLKKTYKIVKDTMFIYHFVSSNKDSINEQFPKKIAIEDIAFIETEYFNWGETCLLVGTIGLASFGLLVFAANASMGQN